MLLILTQTHTHTHTHRRRIGVAAVALCTMALGAAAVVVVSSPSSTPRESVLVGAKAEAQARLQRLQKLLEWSNSPFGNARTNELIQWSGAWNDEELAQRKLLPADKAAEYALAAAYNAAHPLRLLEVDFSLLCFVYICLEGWSV
jgi:hypothetical protein